MPAHYTEIELTADEALSEEIVAVFSQLGFEGFWQEGAALRCYIRSDRWSDEMQREIELVARTIHRSADSPLPTFSIKQIEEKNWNEEWEKTIKPIHVTQRIVITPTWHNYQAQAGELVLTIDPKMSFGTGYHETTRLMLNLMERYAQPGMKLLDVGTGTGVLAIAGIKLGAASAIGVDNDEWSYENAIENCKLNHVHEKVKILLGVLDDVRESGFDMIVANIQRNVIEPLLPAMKSKLKPDGVMILSGLLDVDENPMREAIQGSGFTVQEILRENEWISIVLQPVIVNVHSATTEHDHRLH